MWRLALVSLLALAACRDDGAPTAPSGLPTPSHRAASPHPVKSATATERSEPPTTTAEAAPARPPARAEASEDEDDADDDPEAACAPADPDLKPLQLLRFTFADAVENRDPREKLTVARPGQRTYAHLVLRNRSGRERCVRLEFRVDGKKRTALTLKIGESWSWRTWGYNTLRPEDRGKLEVRVTDDQGNLLTAPSLPIIPEEPSSR